MIKHSDISNSIKLSQSDITNIIQSGKYVHRLAIVQNLDDLSEEHLNQLISDEHYIIRMECAKRLDISQQQLNTLISDPDWYVRLQCAKRKKLSTQQLQTLIKDPIKDIRLYIIQNHKLPQQILNHLYIHGTKQELFILYKLYNN